MEPNLNSEYYFVTFGRKSGGLLDLLNLPPDAPQGEVADHFTTHWRDLESKFKDERKVLKEKHQNNEITKAEFDEKVKQLEDEKNDKQVSVNKLKADYEASQSQKRGLGKKGHWLNIPTWIRLGERLEWSRAGEAYPFTTPQRSYTPEELERYQSSQAAIFQQYNDITFARQLKVLAAADQAWSLLRSTNRADWQSRVIDWIQEAGYYEPTWSLSAVAPLNFKPEFPRLCNPSDLSISQLTAEAMEDFSELPKRSAPQPVRQVRLEDFVDALLKKAMREKAAAGAGSPAKGGEKKQPGGTKSGGDEETSDEMDRFLALMELLSQAPEADQEDK